MNLGIDCQDVCLWVEAIQLMSQSEGECLTLQVLRCGVSRWNDSKQMWLIFQSDNGMVAWMKLWFPSSESCENENPLACWRLIQHWFSLMIIDRLRYSWDGSSTNNFLSTYPQHMPTHPKIPWNIPESRIGWRQKMQETAMHGAKKPMIFRFTFSQLH
jgi:hypothetical protein